MSALVEEEDAEMGEEEEISDADKLAIVQHLMLNAPPGELDEVKSDALNLVPENLVSPAMLAGICRAYNVENLRAIQLEGENKKLIVCSQGEIDPTKYVDPSTGYVYAVDHVAGTTERVIAQKQVEDEETTIESDLNAGTELRQMVENKLNEYVSGRYPNNHGACAVYDATSGKEEDVLLHIVISGENVNLRNYWSGNWRSSWQVSSSNIIQGEIKVRAHYFEDGNVQLQTTKKIEASSLSTDSLPAAIVNYIQENESNLQQGLEDMYANMSHETFKAMRRVMPITRTKMKYVLYFFIFPI